MLPKAENSDCPWMSPQTKSSIENKHNIRKQKGDKSTEYKIAKAESKKLVRKDKLEHVEKQMDIINTLPPHKQNYATIKRLKSKLKNITWESKTKTAKFLQTKQRFLRDGQNSMKNSTKINQIIL